MHHEAQLRAPAAIVILGALAFLGAAARLSANARHDSRALTGDDAASAGRAIELFLRLGTHLYGSSGDARFADRIDARPELVGEMLADIEFLRHSGRIEEPHLVKMELREVRAAGPFRAEARTREYWVTRSRALVGPEDVQSAADVVDARYVLDRARNGWRIVDWSVDLEGAARPSRAR